MLLHQTMMVIMTHLDQFIMVKYLKMQIFDTWGNLIYSEVTSNELIGWNGRISGKDGENGNYFYQVSGNTHTDENSLKTELLL